MSYGFFPNVSTATAPFSSMINAAKAGLAPPGGFNAFSAPGSLFQNPVLAAKPDLDKILNLPFMPQSITASVNEMINQTADDTSGALAGQVATMRQDVSVISAAIQTQQNIRMIDAAASGEPPDPDEEVNQAFPATTDAGCPGFNLSTVMAPITEAAGAIGKVVKDIMRSIGNAVGIAFESVSDLMKHIQEVGADFLQILQGAMGGIVSSITDTVASAMTALKDNLGTMIDAAKDMVNQAIEFLKSVTTLNLFNFPNPCVQQAMAAVSKPSMVDHAAIEVAASPKATNVPIRTGIEVAQSSRPQNAVNTTPGKPFTVLSDIPNKYSPAELADMKKKRDAKVDEGLALKKEAAKKWAEYEEWKVSVDYKTKMEAAGVVRSDESTHLGVSPDPAVNAAWVPIYNESKQRIEVYNDFVENTMNPKLVIAKAMVHEFSIRSAFGRTPYTTSLQRYGGRVPENEQTTFLDSGI
jgi:hypothetical protein